MSVLSVRHRRQLHAAVSTVVVQLLSSRQSTFRFVSHRFTSRAALCPRFPSCSFMVFGSNVTVLGYDTIHIPSVLGLFAESLIIKLEFLKFSRCGDDAPGRGPTRSS
jgi:hypothetical protein